MIQRDPSGIGVEGTLTGQVQLRPMLSPSARCRRPPPKVARVRTCGCREDDRGAAVRQVSLPDGLRFSRCRIVHWRSHVGSRVHAPCRVGPYSDEVER